MIYFLVFLNIILLVIGQFLWKTGVEAISPLTIGSLIKGVFSPLIFSGIVLYGVATLIWLYVLSKAEFSVVYPLQSLAYALGVAMSFFVLKEVIPPTRWIGVVVIIIGAILVARK